MPDTLVFRVHGAAGFYFTGVRLQYFVQCLLGSGVSV